MTTALLTDPKATLAAARKTVAAVRADCESAEAANCAARSVLMAAALVHVRAAVAGLTDKFGKPIQILVIDPLPTYPGSIEVSFAPADAYNDCVRRDIIFWVGMAGCRMRYARSEPQPVQLVVDTTDNCRETRMRTLGTFTEAAPAFAAFCAALAEYLD